MAHACPPLGIAAHTAALAHDVFNVVCISVLDVLNLMNWRLDGPAWAAVRLTDGPELWAGRWAGAYQDVLLAAVFIYMVMDGIFVCTLPQCVKIPKAIIVHHMASLAAMTIPWQHNATHGYTLGIFMLADFNTLFLLLRKMMMRTLKTNEGMPRILFLAVSACFYFTWVVVRLILYPVWLFTVSCPEWVAAWERTGRPANLFVVMPCANLFAVLLNFKWTWDLCSGLWKRKHSVSQAKRSDMAGAADTHELMAPLLGPAHATACVVKRHVGEARP